MPLDPSALQALGLDPSWLDKKRADLSQAYAADDAAQRDEDRKALLMQFASSYVNRRPTPVAARKATDNVAKFGIEAGLENQQREGGLHLLRTMESADAAPKPGEEPLDPAMEEAIRAAGKDPALARNRAEGFRLLGFASQEAARAAADADRDAARGITAENAAATRADREQRAEDRKREIASKGAMGPEFEPLDDTSPLYSDEAGKRKFLASAAASKALSRGVGVVRDVISKNGTNPLTLPAEARSRLKSAIADIRTQIKTIDELGVVAGPDMPQFISPQIDNPATFENHFMKVLGLTDPIAQLNQLEQSMAGGVLEKGSVCGVRLSPTSFFKPYQRAPAASAPAASLPQPKTKAERDALPAGTKYIGPDGKTYTKKG